ncbi:MAG: PfkB family carbohydrate kinase [Planctomycetaceae bacterium]|jgi:rfaE bifunctional protein kinase chain/domain|nr:PfkB family carbohydrate kinase [Planctomycetaceae bacterium]
MNKQRLKEILAKFSTIHIAVIGDYFLDRYWKIDPKRDEPSVETGLTAYQVVDCWGSPGAAGTVVNNLSALGVGKINAIGFLGKDGEGCELAALLDKIGVARTYMIETDQRATPCYTKPLRNGIEMNRFDIKNRTVTPPSVEEKLIAAVQEIINRIDALIIMDQVSEENCGVLTENVRNHLIQLGQKHAKLLIYADSRERIHLYRNIVIKCNERETLEACGMYDGTSPTLDILKQCGLKLAEKTGQAVFVTMGERGQLVVDPANGMPQTKHVPAVPVEGEIDICGAGDASSSAIVASLCAGANYEEAATLGNLASSVTIRKIGQTGTASPEEILETFDKYSKHLTIG